MINDAARIAILFCLFYLTVRGACLFIREVLWTK